MQYRPRKYATGRLLGFLNLPVPVWVPARSGTRQGGAMDGDWHENQALGAQIRRLRSLRRMTVEQLAAAAEVDVTELIDAEWGRTHISALLLSRLAIVLELPLESFFASEVPTDWESDAQILYCISRLNAAQRLEVAAWLTDVVDDVRIRRDWQPAGGQPIVEQSD